MSLLFFCLVCFWWCFLNSFLIDFSPENTIFCAFLFTVRVCGCFSMFLFKATMFLFLTCL